MQGVLSVIFQNESYEPKMDCTVPETNSHALQRVAKNFHTDITLQFVYHSFSFNNYCDSWGFFPTL